MESKSVLKRKAVQGGNGLSDGLDPEDIEIMQAQKKIKVLGWQWKEQIYNDHFGKSAECQVSFIKSTNPCWEEHSKGTIGWGRFSRISCWRQALEEITR